FEEVVQGVDLERLEGVAVVGGDEDDGRHPLGADRLEHAEAVQAGHLHVQEDQLRLGLGQGGDGLAAVGALAPPPGVGLALPAASGPSPARAPRHRRSGSGSPPWPPFPPRAPPWDGAVWNGTATVTTRPPSGPLPISKCWASPYSCCRRARVLATPTPSW